MNSRVGHLGASLLLQGVNAQQPPGRPRPRGVRAAAALGGGICPLLSTASVSGSHLPYSLPGSAGVAASHLARKRRVGGKEDIRTRRAPPARPRGSGSSSSRRPPQTPPSPLRCRGPRRAAPRSGGAARSQPSAPRSLGRIASGRVSARLFRSPPSRVTARPAPSHRVIPLELHSPTWRCTASAHDSLPYAAVGAARVRVTRSAARAYASVRVTRAEKEERGGRVRGPSSPGRARRSAGRRGRGR